MLKRAALIFVAISGMLAAAPAPAPQPVFIVIYYRFYDHSHQHTTDERIQRLLPMLRKFRDQHPQSDLSALFQFSGTVSERSPFQAPRRRGPPDPGCLVARPFQAPRRRGPPDPGQSCQMLPRVAPGMIVVRKRAPNGSPPRFDRRR